LEEYAENFANKEVGKLEDWLASSIGLPVCHSGEAAGRRELSDNDNVLRRELVTTCHGPLGALEDAFSKFMCKKVGGAIGSACEKVAGAIAKAAGSTVDGIEDELVNHA
jgi:hypothetical protein